MHDHDTRPLIRDLESRLDRIEAHLGLEPRVAKPATPTPAPAIESTAAPVATLAPPVEPTFTPPSAHPVASAADARRELRALTQPVTPPITPPPPPVEPSAPRRSLEEMIGRYWVAWVGSIVVVVGVGLFVKFAYDEGWIQHLAPAVRCLLAAVFGGLLIGAGEVVLRRVGRAGGAGLFTAGLGTWYLTVYAALHLGVVGEAGALAWLTAVSGAGLALTWRTRHLAIGVLSVIVGYFAVMFLGPPTALPTGTPMYLTMLLGIALGVSGVSRHPFRPLRYVALGSHGIMALYWVLWASSEWRMMLPFIVIWWAMVAAEALWAGLREQSPIGNAVSSLLSTAWFVVVGSYVLVEYISAGEHWLGAFYLMIAGVAIGAAFQFGPGLDALRTRPRRAIDKLTVALWCQAGVLLTMAIAAQFDGWGKSIGWLMLGLAGVELGRRLRARGVTIFGLIVGALGVIRVATFERFEPSMMLEVTSILGVSITPWMLLALTTVAAIVITARRVVPIEDDRPAVLASVLTTMAAIGWCAIWQVTSVGLAPAWAWMIAGTGLVLAHRVGQRQHALEIGAMVLACTMVRWLILDVVAVRLAADWIPTSTPFFNETMILGVFLVVAGWWTTRLLADRPADGFRPFMAGLIPSVAIIAVLFSVEHVIASLEHGGMTTAWDSATLRSIWLSGTAGLAGLSLAFLARWRGWQTLATYGGMILGTACGVWLIGATFLPRMIGGAVATTPFWNAQFGVGLMLAGMAIALVRAWPRDVAIDDHRVLVVPYLSGVLGFIGLWLGLFELDRIFAVATDAATRQTAFSIYGGIYGAALITIGFIWRMPLCRWAGLALLGLVVGKVLLVDLAEVGRVWRVLSFVIVGLVLLATSVGYARVAQREAARALAEPRA